MEQRTEAKVWRMVGWVCGLFAAVGVAQAQTVGACGFDRSTLQFKGAALQQAQCLLRPVARWGKVQAAPAELPPGLAALLGQPVAIERSKLRSHFAEAGVDEASMGGSLDRPVSARYFVIHDTSSPWLGDAPNFPADDTPSLNNLSMYRRPNAVAHVFIGRSGQTLVGHDFSVPWRATKLETQVIGGRARGLFLHIELVQPRRRDPAGGPKNDALAPTPGFTPVQYERLAGLYAAASVRAGRWLVPSLHAAIDEGLADAHDDPQNFVLADFAAALERLLPLLLATESVPAQPLAAARLDSSAQYTASGGAKTTFW